MAMPRPMAEALGWPRTKVGWRELVGVVAEQKGWKTFGHPEWGLQARQDRPQPVHARDGGADRGRVRGHRADQRALGRDAGQAGGPAPAGHPAWSGPWAGRRHARDLPGQPPAGRPGRPDPRLRLRVPLDEKSVWDYNRGNASGLEDGGERAKPEVRWSPSTPRKGRWRPTTRGWCCAPWVDETKRRAAAGFLDYLRSEPIQARFQEAGFRTSEGRPGPQLSEANGLVPDQPARGAGPAGPQGGGGGAAELERGPQAEQRAGRL